MKIRSIYAVCILVLTTTTACNLLPIPPEEFEIKKNPKEITLNFPSFPFAMWSDRLLVYPFDYNPNFSGMSGYLSGNILENIDLNRFPEGSSLDTVISTRTKYLLIVACFKGLDNFFTDNDGYYQNIPRRDIEYYMEIPITEASIYDCIDWIEGPNW